MSGKICTEHFFRRITLRALFSPRERDRLRSPSLGGGSPATSTELQRSPSWSKLVRLLLAVLSSSTGRSSSIVVQNLYAGRLVARRASCVKLDRLSLSQLKSMSPLEMREDSSSMLEAPEYTLWMLVENFESSARMSLRSSPLSSPDSWLCERVLV